MRQILFEIGPIKIYSYGLMIAIGVVMAFYVAEKRAPKKGLDAEQIFPLGIWCAIGGFLGAKVLYVITEYEKLFAGRMSFRDVMYGFVVYGGIIGGILAGYVYCKVKKLNFLKYFDIVMPSIALAQGFGRIGCFLAGCCYGRETDAWYGMEFNHSVYQNMVGVKVIPTQLIMSVADFAHFFLLAYIANKVYKTGKDGVIAGCYLLFYSIGRFFIEFLRSDPRGDVGILSTSQFISLFIFAAGVGMVLFFGLRKEKNAEIAKAETKDVTE
ncbi:MAG: prolipoprotein diacylglyceryl transferase [Lachnospiraceae bacterium]|nr:prolipoprotein diacylglyceryl transferase [Lachnospiraceae bacterium]